MIAFTCAGSRPSALKPGQQHAVHLVGAERVDHHQACRTCGSRRPPCRCCRSRTRCRRCATAGWVGSLGLLYAQAPRRRSALLPSTSRPPRSWPRATMAWTAGESGFARCCRGRGGACAARPAAARPATRNELATVRGDEDGRGPLEFRAPSRVEAPGAGACDGEIQEHDEVQQRLDAAVGNRPHRSRLGDAARMRASASSDDDEGGLSDEQSEDQQRAGDGVRDSR